MIDKLIKEMKMAQKKNTSNKRMESTTKYIDALSENYSKLNIVRVDLAYKKPHSDDMTLEDANRDLDRMFNNMRSKPSIFENKVGYVCKREYTKKKGVHFHTVFIYDGQKVQNDIFKGEQIGKYWNQITEEKGSYHNCNRTKYEERGVGMLEHNDSDKRRILDEVVLHYMHKDEQNIKQVAENKKTRAFTRGVAPKKKGNIGRPRG